MTAIPFFSQLIDESNYQVEGFPDLKTAQEWTDRLCGLACLKMVVAHFTGENVSIWELLQEGFKVGAYKPGKGWVHEGLVQLGRKFGVEGSRESIGSDLSKITEYLNNGETLVASVSGSFDITRRGGHLVVLIKSRHTHFVVHHPSSWKGYNWPNYEVSKEQFSKSFSERGNIIRFYNINAVLR